ncbi:DUF1292 domain-containing protein [Oscillospiraceae bacterium OttesenSCG-928-F05]|nr:DUF1292 domain-containing protein [Oscillospiraceae bacterium OttesenSCG-928-F05]
MAEDFGADLIVLEDDEGNEFEVEVNDTLDYKGESYISFITEDDDGEEALAILKIEEEGDEEIFVTVDDEETLDAVYALFVSRMEDDGDDLDETV